MTIPARSANNRLISVSRLREGDRFLWRKNLYTWLKIDYSRGVFIIARKHGRRSIELQRDGWGYNGDSIVSFRPSRRVEFIPPNHITEKEPTR